MPDDLEDFEFAVAARFPAFSWGRSVVLATPREVVDYVAARTVYSPDQRSVKQHAFYFIRGRLAAKLDRHRGEILPQTKLEELLPDPDRRRGFWKPLSQDLKIPLFPRLSRPSGVQWAITLTVAVLSYAVLLLAGFALEGSSVALLAAVAFAAGLCALLFRVTEKFATEFAATNLTMGDLACYATAYGSKNLDVSIDPSSRSQIWEVVRDLVRLEIGTIEIDEDATWEELQASARSAP